MENTLLVNENRSIQFDDPIVNYVSVGTGEPVILAHGLAASLHDWDDLMPELAAAGYAGHALDLLGHGDSHKPADHLDYTIDHVLDHYVKWIDSLRIDDAMVLVGHSLGGGLSLMYALRFPERVRALVLVNPFYEIEQLPPVMQSIFRRQLLNTYLIDRTPYRLFRMLVDMTSFSVHIGHREPHILPEHIRYQTALDYKRASSGIYNIPRTLPDLTEDLSRVHQPTLLIWGGRDQTLSPSSFPRLARSLPNVKAVHSMPVCGHVPHQCHAQMFNPLVMDFMTNL
jgi:pimeloyl-ACP methyl ester carboxylesterase